MSMRVVIAGGHGKIARRLERLLAAGGHEPVGIIRSPDQAADRREAGAEPALMDLGSAWGGGGGAILQGAEAAVSAAGPGGWEEETPELQ